MFVVGQYMDKTALSIKKIADICEISMGQILSITYDKNAFLMATYKAMPISLSGSGSFGYQSIKEIGDKLS